MMGKKERRSESETERERLRERRRATQRREKTACVNFDLWSNSPTPENFL
jgi:hypothetical protein